MKMLVIVVRRSSSRIKASKKKSSYSPPRCNEVVREVGQDAIKSPMADAYLYHAVEITSVRAGGSAHRGKDLQLQDDG